MLYWKIKWLRPGIQEEEVIFRRKPSGEDVIERWPDGYTQPASAELDALDDDPDFKSWAFKQQVAPLLTRVEIRAEEVRAVHITVGAGKGQAYREKSGEIDRYDTMVAAGQTPTDGEFPMLSPEAVAVGLSLPEMVKEVRAKRQAWRVLAGQIEAVCQGAKKAILEAGSFEKAQAVVASIEWPYY